MASSRLTKQNIKKLFEEKKEEYKKKDEFIKRLQVTIQTETEKLSKLEGAILLLHELYTGKKAEK